MQKWKFGHPLKWIITAACLLGVFYYSSAQTEGGGLTHDCVTVPLDSGGLVVHCQGLGSICNTVSDCMLH